MIDIINEAISISDEIIEFRRHIHQFPELGMNTKKTCEYIKKLLIKFGYDPFSVGKAGVCAIVGNPNKGKTILLRADMDALPIKEETGLSFSSSNENMHACGHDCHVSMLLGAAKILKKYEKELNGCIKLFFQSGEETMEGAIDAVDSGLLENPKVGFASMIHILSGNDFPSNFLAVFGGGPCYSSVDWFRIDIKGKGSHGAQPEESINPFSIMTNIFNVINEYVALGIPASEQAIISIGEMKGGTVSNVIPDSAFITGTIRTFNNTLREKIKKDLIDICTNTAKIRGGSIEFSFTKNTPSVVCNKDYSNFVLKSLAKIFGADKVVNLNEFQNGIYSKVMGSEDFSFISNKVPSSVILLSAGSKNEGYIYPAHHPKTDFDESALYMGTASYVQIGLESLKINI